MKKPLIIANWKMYVEKPEAAKKFIVSLKRKLRTLPADVVVAPGFTLLPSVALATKGSSVRVAGQTVSAYVDGQHTGDVSAAMLKAAGATWVIVGHSERRADVHETNEVVRAQIESAHEAGLVVVLCVGELERDPSGAHFSVIAQQLASALANGGTKILAKKIVVAYEPVWAIGKNAAEAVHAGDLHEMVIFIRKNLADTLGRSVGVKVPILYGGSVDATNAWSLLHDGGVAGFLVGRASADVDSFTEILRVCKK